MLLVVRAGIIRDSLVRNSHRLLLLLGIGVLGVLGVITLLGVGRVGGRVGRRILGVVAGWFSLVETKSVCLGGSCLRWALLVVGVVIWGLARHGNGKWKAKEGDKMEVGICWRKEKRETKNKKKQTDKQ